MENRNDIAIVSALKALGVGVALMSVMFASTAWAEYRVYKYYEMYGYDAELQHCVELLRPTMAAADNEKAYYFVEEIKLRGPWYRFKIKASVYDDEGVARVEEFKVTCNSNRWIESGRLVKRYNKAESDLPLVVKDSGQLLSYNLMNSDSMVARNSAEKVLYQE